MKTLQDQKLFTLTEVTPSPIDSTIAVASCPRTLKSYGEKSMNIVKLNNFNKLQNHD